VCCLGASSKELEAIIDTTRTFCDMPEGYWPASLQDWVPTLSPPAENEPTDDGGIVQGLQGPAAGGRIRQLFLARRRAPRRCQGVAANAPVAALHLLDHDQAT
jgi:hypothetical protein